MSFIIIGLLFILSLSFSLNVFLFWFSYKSFQQNKYYDQELTETILSIKTFTNHLKSVYELEMFYGDETLRHLMRHAGEVIDVFDGYDLDINNNEEEEYEFHLSEASQEAREEAPKN